MIVYGWMFHSVVLAGDTLLGQHPLRLLGTSPAAAHRQPDGGYRKAAIEAERVMRPGASVAIVFRSLTFPRNYAYYWATLQMYPRPVVIADTTEQAAVRRYGYILDVRDQGQPRASLPDTYQLVKVLQYPDGTVMTIMVHA